MICVGRRGLMAIYAAVRLCVAVLRLVVRFSVHLQLNIGAVYEAVVGLYGVRGMACASVLYAAVRLCTAV